MSDNYNKAFIILIGPSGSGKTTLGKYLKDELNIPEAVSHTTREPRSGEVNGISYYFVDQENFFKLERFEQTEYPKNSGNFYCLSCSEVYRRWNDSDIIFATTDIRGAAQIKSKLGKRVSIIYVSIPQETIEKRMRQRGDSEENIQKRLQQSIITEEFENWRYADYVISNINLDKAKTDLVSIVEMISKSLFF